MKYEKETFEIVMNSLGWINLDNYELPYSTTSYQQGNLYMCNGFVAHFNSYYISIRGKMPTPYAIDLHENYNSDELAIRADGHGDNLAPTFRGSDNKEVADLYIKLRETRTSSTLLDSVNEECDLLEKKLIETNPYDFYIRIYHIDTWEGLKVFTKYIKDNKIVVKWFE